MKGIILAGGLGTRLHPLTLSLSKHILPIYDKPMIYYPLSILMFSGIREILVISSENNIVLFKYLLNTGEQWGIQFSYAVQKEPQGIAQAFLIAEDFIGKDEVCLVLGDNVFYGDRLPATFKECAKLKDGAIIFGYWVKDPCRYGVVEFDKNFRVIDVVEKPKNPQSNYAIPGLYYYDNKVLDYAKVIKPSWRGELEITDVNKLYLESNKLQVKPFGRGVVWLDTGTFESLMEASNYVYIIEKRQGLKIACPEEIAWRMGFIDDEQFLKLAYDLSKSAYGEYLLNIFKDYQKS